MSYWRFPTSIFTKYSVEQVIRSSGLSKVYKARPYDAGEMVAIKVLKLPPGMEEALAKNKISRFQREASLCLAADHPNIIKLLEYVHEPWHAPYAVYEYVEGRTLKELIWEKRGLDAKETAMIMTQVLDALKLSHSKGIVHRDLKPDNIMVTDTTGKCHVKLLDFGIGTWQDPDGEDAYEPLTLPNEFLGTPAYAAPEQLIGQKPTVKFDLYAWGLILLECLTGRPAITGHSLNEVVCRQLAGDTVSLPRWLDQHPVADLLEKVLARNPMSRTATVSATYDLFSQIDFSDLKPEKSVEARPDVDSLQQTTMTENLVQHQDFETEKLLVACFRVQIKKSRSGEWSETVLESMRLQEYEWLTQLIKSERGRVVSVLANSFMVTFSGSEFGERYILGATDVLKSVLKQARLRFADLHQRFGLQAEVSLGINAGLALVEPNGTPFGIIPNVALDLMSKAGPGQALVGAGCKEDLVPSYLLMPFRELRPEEVPLPVSAYSIELG